MAARFVGVRTTGGALDAVFVEPIWPEGADVCGTDPSSGSIVCSRGRVALIVVRVGGGQKEQR